MKLIAAAAAEATALVAAPQDEPAALFFALARRQRAFPGLWTAVVGLLVINQARSVGLSFAGEAKDLLPMYVPVARGAMRFDEVRAWFIGVLHPKNTVIRAGSGVAMQAFRRIRHASRRIPSACRQIRTAYRHGFRLPDRSSWEADARGSFPMDPSGKTTRERASRPIA
jgi:hypothetical protein